MPQFAFFSRDREKRARRTRARQRHARARHYRPIVELLELRALLATDITISTLTTSGGTFSGNSSLQTFTPTAGAHTAVVNRTDIESFLNAGTSVTIDTSLGTGTAAGNISYSSTATITKSAGANATLTLRANNNLTISLAISSSANALTIVAIGDSDLTGGGTTTVFAPLTSGGGNIQISGDAVAVDAAVNSGAGTITINANADGAGESLPGFASSDKAGNGRCAIDDRAPFPKA